MNRSMGGFSLVEALVAMVTGLMVAMAVTSFSIALIQNHTETVQSTRVLQDLRVTSDLVVREIQRSGFDRDAIRLVANQDDYTNAFSTLTWGEEIAAPANACASLDGADLTSSCLMFSYDRPGVNDDASAPDGTETKGFRLVTVETSAGDRGVIQMFIGAAAADPACDDAVDAAGWQDITPPGVDVTAFVLADKSPDPLALASIPGAQVSVRTVGLHTSARPSGILDGRVRTVCDDIRVRADAVSFTP